MLTHVCRISIHIHPNLSQHVGWKCGKIYAYYADYKAILVANPSPMSDHIFVAYFLMSCICGISPMSSQNCRISTLLVALAKCPNIHLFFGSHLYPLLFVGHPPISTNICWVPVHIHPYLWDVGPYFQNIQPFQTVSTQSTHICAISLFSTHICRTPAHICSTPAPNIHPYL